MPDRNSTSDSSPDDKRAESANLERDIKMGEICLIIINGLLLVTSIVIACIYYGQLQQMTKATKATEQAAKAAQDSVDLTRQQLANSQAATLGLRFAIIADAPFTPLMVYSIVEYRSGSAMASNFHQSFDVYWKSTEGMKAVSPEELPDVGDPEHFEFDIPQLRNTPVRLGTKSAPGVPLRSASPEILENLQRTGIREKTIYIKGTFRYNNGFSPVPDEPFCYIWFGPTAEFIQCSEYVYRVKVFLYHQKKAAEEKK